MTILILCAGKSKRFKWEGISKHRLPVFGEELLSRTVRQCRERIGYTDEITVITDNFEITLGIVNTNYSIYTPEKYNYICQTLRSTYNVWGDGQNIILLGDVIYSDTVLDNIFSSSYPVMFYGSAVYNEIYALVFVEQTEMLWALDRVNERVAKGYHGQLWQLFYVLNKLPGHVHPANIPYRIFRHVNDFTQDFDTIEDYEKFLHFKEEIYKEV